MQRSSHRNYLFVSQIQGRSYTLQAQHSDRKAQRQGTPHSAHCASISVGKVRAMMRDKLFRCDVMRKQTHHRLLFAQALSLSWACLAEVLWFSI